ncbi:thioredoxin family protein [Spirosoma migulaei]
MNFLIQLLIVGGFSLLLPHLTLPVSIQPLSHKEENATKASYEPVAVLELFTSQGCSSCPSADRLLTETLADAVKTNKNIVGLSFHVDYWDRLGWKDPFSSHAFTKRQYQYSEHFNQNGVYTPQEVLNGQQEFVGSNRSKQISLLKTALSTPATAKVQLSTSPIKDNRLTVTYQLEGEFSNAVLNVALVSKTTETTVQRGENAGRKLIHDNVVRAFQTIPAITKGNVSFTLPSDFDAHNGAIVVYVQSQQTLAVRGATKVDLLN